jgi:S-adenosylmethionine decarboxylase
MLNNQISTPLDGFEGPEKKLEIEFLPMQNASHNTSLRNVSKETWQTILDYVNCKILSATRNQHFDSFVLSESSLFVYDYKFMLKTCGTTTLLKVIRPLLALATELQLEVSFVFYSRSKFIFPDKQLYPHTNWSHEVECLDNYFDGTGYIFGPMKNDHWHMYICDYRDEEFTLRSKPDQTLEVIMFDLDPTVMKQFFKDKDFVSSKKTTISSGISKLIPGSIIDSYQFDPCGYSMNGLLENAYWTIHITPEDHCSYVSFETNISPELLGNRTYTDLVRDVARTFKPGRWYATLFADDHLFTENDISLNWEMSGYKTKNKTHMKFDGPYNVTMVSYEKETTKYKRLDWMKSKLFMKEDVDMFKLSKEESIPSSPGEEAMVLSD